MLRILNPKQMAPKSIKEADVTLKKSTGLFISCLNLRILEFTSNKQTSRQTKLHN